MEKKIYITKTLVENHSEEEASCSVEVFTTKDAAREYRRNEMEEYISEYVGDDTDEDEEFAEVYDDNEDEWFTELGSSGICVTISVEEKCINE